MIIDGFGIRNYRSFGPEPQYFGPFNKVSLFIGQNNCGKSNILRFASNHLADIVKAARQRGTYGAFSSLDETRIDRDGVKEFSLGLKIDGDLYQTWIGSFHEKFRGGLLESLRKLTEDDLMTDGTDLCWFWYELRDNRVELSSRMLQALFESDGPLSPFEWSTLWQKAQNASGGSLDHWIPAIMQFINPARSLDIEVENIPAIREIRPSSADTELDFSGAGLTERLLITKTQVTMNKKRGRNSTRSTHSSRQYPAQAPHRSGFLRTATQYLWI